MKFISDEFWCFFGIHKFDNGYWFEARLKPQEDWVRVKTCVRCFYKKLA